MNTNYRRNTIRIAFSWQTLTSENLGVAALAQANLEIAKKAAIRKGLDIESIEFCPTGPNRDLAITLNSEIADPLSPKNILMGRSRYVQQLRECDVVLDIGAGDSFSDIYGGRHFFFLSLSKIVAILLRKPLVFSPQTIGPFNSFWVRRLSAFLLKRAEQVFARDAASMECLRQKKIIGNTQEVIDVAFRLPYNRQISPDCGKVRVGLNVSGLLMNGGYTRDNQFGLKADYVELIRLLIDEFVSNPDVELHLVPHVLACTLPVEDDFAMILQLKQSYPSVIVAPRFKSPSEAKSYIAGLDFFAGARMHACIAAFSSGVPVVPMAYSRKFNGLFNSLGYRHIADLKNDDTKTAFEVIVNGFRGKDVLKAEVAVGNRQAQNKLQYYEDYLAELFEKIAQR